MRSAPSERHCAGWTGLGSSGSTTSSNSSGSTSGSRAAQLSVRKDYPVFFNFGTRRKRARGAKMERQVCRYGALRREGGREARGAACETCSHSCCSLPKGLVGFFRGCGAKAHFLFAATSVCTVTFAYLTFRVLLISRTPSFYWGDHQTFLSLMESRRETGNEAEMLCLTLWTPANAQFYDPVMSGEWSFTP